jgi:signal transduction histidine kinase/CheY-like chemotaxis protein
MTSSLDFSSLFDASPDPCLVLDPALRIVTANRAYLGAMGCARDDIVGCDWFDAFPDYAGAAELAGHAIRISLHGVRETGRPDTLDFLHYPILTRRRRQDDVAESGAASALLLDRYWRITHTPIHGIDGSLQAILQHCTDITLAQRAAPAWAGLSASLEHLFASAPGFMCLLQGPDRIVECANKAFLHLTGHRSLNGRRLDDALPEWIGQSISNHLDAAWQSGLPMVGSEAAVRLPDVVPGDAADTVYLDYVVQPVRGAAGEVRGLFLQGHNVTAKRLAIEALQRDRSDLQGLVQESVRALHDSESERRQAEAALAQSQKMEAVGKLTGGVAHDFNNVLQIISGNVQLADRDLGTALARLAETSETVSLLSSRDTVSSHAQDERSSVAAARVAAARARLLTALEAVARGAKLASQLLAFARRQPLQPSVVAPRALCVPMVDMMRRLLGETIRVETMIEETVQPALVDANQLENVLLNLAVNARDAMDGEGTLTIRVQNAVIDSGFASRHPGLRAGEYVMFALTDTGCGMSPDVLDRVFEPFYTTKPPGQGTGLGLSMAYGFAKQSNGHIYIDSTMGKGTSVRLYLPCAAPSFSRADPLAPQHDAAISVSASARRVGDVVSSGKGGAQTAFATGTMSCDPHAVVPTDAATFPDDDKPRNGVAAATSPLILVAEDDADVRETVVALIRGLGYAVLACDSGDAAISVLRDARGADVALLFSDVIMPGPLRGAALLSAVRTARPGLPVLFTSGYTDEELAHGGRLDPGLTLLAKPYDAARLAQTLRTALGPVAGTGHASDRETRRPERSDHGDRQRPSDEPSERVQQDRSDVVTGASVSDGLSILLVEDDDNARHATVALLEALGHRVMASANGEHALLVLADWRPDVLVTDLNLPGMSGAELVRQVDLPTVMVSGMGLVHGRGVSGVCHGRAADTGAHGFCAGHDNVGGTGTGTAAEGEARDLPVHVVPLGKPFSLDALTQALEAALRYRTTVTSGDALMPSGVGETDPHRSAAGARARKNMPASSLRGDAPRGESRHGDKTVSSRHSPRDRAGHA